MAATATFRMALACADRGAGSGDHGAGNAVRTCGRRDRPQITSAGATNGSRDRHVGPSHHRRGGVLRAGEVPGGQCLRLLPPEVRPAVPGAGRPGGQRGPVRCARRRPDVAHQCRCQAAASTGTYYIHIAGHDRVYDACPSIEFSDMMEITIKDGGAVESRLYGPGTGDCTLRRNSPASGGGSGGGGAKFNDETLPVAKLRYSRKQDIDKLRVRARMSEPGTLTARATVSVGGLLARLYTFKPASRTRHRRCAGDPAAEALQEAQACLEARAAPRQAAAGARGGHGDGPRRQHDHRARHHPSQALTDLPPHGGD